MRRLRVYTSEAQAHMAAAFLRRHGIVAGVVGEHAAHLFTLPKLIGPRIELFALVNAQASRAAELLKEMDEQPVTLDEDWESQAVPDLSRLDPSIRSARCTCCGTEFPLDGSVVDCGSCGAGLDFTECILASHGPEALAPCYEHDNDPVEINLDELDLPCPSCNHSLVGLAAHGACPQCGQLYDKAEMLRTLGL